jgi:hypothetical protein
MGFLGDARAESTGENNSFHNFFENDLNTGMR